MSVPTAVLDTVIARLALLFRAGAQGNETAARLAAAQMLATYDPQTGDELRLAANIISFGFHALEALSQAAAPDMPLARVLRLRGSAVSLSREAHKAEHRLQQLRKARLDATPATPPPEANPTADKAIALITDTRTVADLALQTKQTWTQAYHQRQRDKRLARRAAKRQTTANHATVM